MVFAFYVPASVLIIPVKSIKQATVLRIKIALSFQITPIAIQPAQPTKERHMSAKGNSPEDLSDIATNIIIDDVHLMYQSKVSFGVLKLVINCFMIRSN
tara:strand:- start:454 stop:750 length:297 start_codon:yes stop_codon:yes gene_type:complete